MREITCFWTAQTCHLLPGSLARWMKSPTTEDLEELRFVGRCLRVRPVDEVFFVWVTKQARCAHIALRVFGVFQWNILRLPRFHLCRGETSELESKAPNPDFSGGTRVGGKHMNTSFSGALFALFFYVWCVFLHTAAIVPHVFSFFRAPNCHWFLINVRKASLRRQSLRCLSRSRQPLSSPTRNKPRLQAPCGTLRTNHRFLFFAQVISSVVTETKSRRVEDVLSSVLALLLAPRTSNAIGDAEGQQSRTNDVLLSDSEHVSVR